MNLIIGTYYFVRAGSKYLIITRAFHQICSPYLQQNSTKGSKHCDKLIKNPNLGVRICIISALKPIAITNEIPQLYRLYQPYPLCITTNKPNKDSTTSKSIKKGNLSSKTSKYQHIQPKKKEVKTQRNKYISGTEQFNQCKTETFFVQQELEPKASKSKEVVDD